MAKSTAMALTLALLATSSCMSNRFLARTTVTVNGDYQTGDGLDVTAHNGSIQVIGGSGEDSIRVEAKIKVSGETQDEADGRLADVTIHCERDAASNRLVLKPVYADKRRSRDGVSFIVHVPSSSATRLNTSNGNIETAAIAGDLFARSSNGTIQVKDHAGSIDVETSNGKLKLVGITGKIVARSSNGSVNVDLPTKSTGPVQVHTSNGNISFAVAADFAGKLQMRTSNGRVRVKNAANTSLRQNLSKKNGWVQFEAAGEDSKIRTSNGNITISVR